MTMHSLQSLNDQAAESLTGGWCQPNPCAPTIPCMPKFPSFHCLPVIKLPELCLPKISIDWGKCKPTTPVC